MVTLSLLNVCKTRHDFECFSVEVWRCDSTGTDYFYLVGRCVNLLFRHTIWSFPVENLDYAAAYNDSLDVCDMLNYLLELKREERTESEALQLTAALYPEHFKYLAELGYESPAEGGAPDANN